MFRLILTFLKGMKMNLTHKRTASSFCRWHGGSGFFCLVVVFDAGLEHALVYTAQRAAPIIGKGLKRSTRSNAMLRVTFFGVISISTGIAKIFLHSDKSPFYVMNNS